MTDEVQNDGDRELTEEELVSSWRMLSLLDHGWSMESAGAIAVRTDIDLEQARKVGDLLKTPEDESYALAALL